MGEDDGFVAVLEYLTLIFHVIADQIQGMRFSLRSKRWSGRTCLGLMFAVFAIGVLPSEVAIPIILKHDSCLERNFGT